MLCFSEVTVSAIRLSSVLYAALRQIVVLCMQACTQSNSLLWLDSGIILHY